MNIIFLDVDGVINSVDNLKRVYKIVKRPMSGFNYPFDDNCLRNLYELVNKTNSKIVIISSWRKYEDGLNILLNKLDEYDLRDKVIGITNSLNSREKEIIEYLKELGIDSNFVILDDRNKYRELLDYLVLVDSYYGLKNSDIEKAIKILRKK